jgi:molybdopterin converting factor subunit 1
MGGHEIRGRLFCLRSYRTLRFGPDASKVYAGRMRVKVLCFGVLKDLLGVAKETVELPDGAAVGDLLRILQSRASNVNMEEQMWKSVAVAVNRQYETAACVLREGDEVALLPPVSGGSYAERPW